MAVLRLLLTGWLGREVVKKERIDWFTVRVTWLAERRGRVLEEVVEVAAADGFFGVEVSWLDVVVVVVVVVIDLVELVKSSVLSSSSFGLVGFVVL